MKKINYWYKENMGKVLLLSIMLTFFTVTVKLIPYFNFLFSGEIGFPIVFFAWYYLFSPSTKLLVFIALGLLSVAFLSAYFQLDTISNYLGDFLYFELLLILINYVKEFIKDRDTLAQ